MRILLHPGFVCSSPGANDGSQFVVPISILLQEAADNDALKDLSGWIEDPLDEFRDLYSVIDGAILYFDSKRRTEGLHLYSLCEWKLHTNQMRKRYLRDTDEFTGDIRFLTDSHAFACVPRSGNYFTVINTGDDSGKIFYVDHDDWQYEPFANTLTEFISRIVNDPARFLADVGCYAQFSDGQTDTKWIPEKFVSDLKTVDR